MSSCKISIWHEKKNHLDTFFLGIKFFKLKYTLKVALQYHFNVFIIFNTVSCKFVYLKKPGGKFENLEKICLKI